MIVYEPPGELQLPRGSRVRKRELRAFITAAAAEIPLCGEVSVLLTGDQAIRTLNRQFRKKDKATDVLSFPAGDAGGMPARMAGDLAVSVETALRQAAEAGHALETELKVLLLHGLLHLAGYDHERDAGEMRRREEELRNTFGLPAGLIARNVAAKRPIKAAVRSPARKASTGPADKTRAGAKAAAVRTGLSRKARTR